MRTVNEDYDVAVAGGGLAGLSAAISAARHGARTVLVQDRPVLGGNSSSEVRVTPHGAAAFHGYARESGIIAEALVEDRATNHATIEENGWTNSVWDLTLYDMVVRTENLTLHLNTGVEQAEVKDGRIISVDARTWGAEVIHHIEAKVFIDCTGDGTLGALAGNPVRYGQESRSEFGEVYAPDEADDLTMGSSLHFKTVDTGSPTTFTAPEWAVRYENDDFLVKGGRKIQTLKSGYWWIELGAPWNTLYENEKLRHELTRHVLGIWDYLKNRHPYWSQRAGTLALDWVGQVPGKRESRRLEGQHLLVEQDLTGNRVFTDEVAFGGWYLDLHTIGGLLKEVAEPSTQNQWSDPHSASMGSKYVAPFGIPLGSLLSSSITNLLFAGRNISATHSAMSATRVMGTCASMGQAVGVAAARNRSAENVVESSARDVSGIQQTLLRDGAFLVNTKNEDAADLARSARVTASSCEVVTGVGPSSPNRMPGVEHWKNYPLYPLKGNLERRNAQWIIRGAEQKLESISLALSNSSEVEKQISVSLYAVTDIWDYRVEAGTPIATTELTVPVGGPTWVEWAVDLEEVSTTQYVRVDAEACEDVVWHISPAVQPGQIAAYEDSPGHYRRFGSGQTLSFLVDPPQRGYEAEQVLSGQSRPHTSTNQWRSDPAHPLPAWLDLEWDTPQEIRQIQLTLSGQLLREYHAYPAFFRDPDTLRDYEVQAQSESGWTTIVRVTDNYATRNVHTLDSAVHTSKLRVKALSTNGAAAASIYEVRVYSDDVCTSPSFSGEESPLT